MKRKDRKSRTEEKVVGFSSASLFPARKQVPKEPLSAKAGRTSETRGASQIHPRKTKITRARAP